MADIARWLEGLGLGKYATAFAAAEIDFEAVPHLTEGDLKELGLPIGPRRKVLAAVEVLANRMVPTSDMTASVTPPRGEAERRQLTVLFADLVGSTAMAQGADPEDVARVLRGFQDAAAGAITRYEGHVAKFMGDGVLAYFGYPRAHEDDAERAVRSAIALVEAVRGLVGSLQVRVGIATGLVVVGDILGEGGAREETAVGDTLNLAARMQHEADPGNILIAPSTRQLLAQVFDLERLGARTVKGVTEAVAPWRVVGEGAVESRFEASRSQRLNRLVGREQELALALARWEQAKAGEGQVVLLRAEAGIGKSRLIAELRSRLAPDAAASLRYQCSPHHGNSALYPIIQHLKRAAQFDVGDTAEAKTAKLATLVAQSKADRLTAVPLLAALLSIPPTDAYPVPYMTPQQQKSATLGLLVDSLAGLAKVGQVLMVVEDLHWVDPTTRELLDLIVGRIERLPVFLVVTFRPEIVSPWEGRGHVTQVALNRLGKRQVESLIEAVTGGSALPLAVVEQIVAKADGIPLFVEELTKAILDSGFLKDGGDRWELTGALPAVAVPSSLQASLISRLDRLASARVVAQIGAALGREFEFDLLAAVAQFGNDHVADALGELQRAELIFPRGVAPRTNWFFKHALIQDAAYETLLKSSRVELHARIAATIETQFPNLAEAEPETMARHCREAQLDGAAIGHLYRAAQKAMGRSAGADAVAHLRVGLEIIHRIEVESERLRAELRLLTTLGPALIATTGYASAEVESVYVRAAALADQLNDASLLVTIYHGRWTNQATRSNHRNAMVIAHEFADRATRLGDPLAVGTSLRSLGTQYVVAGSLAIAQQTLLRAQTILEQLEHGPAAWQLAQDPLMTAQIWGALCLWLRGFPDASSQLAAQAEAQATRVGHPQTIAFCAFYSAILANWRHDQSEVDAQVSRIEKVADQHAMEAWHAMSAQLRAIAIVNAGRVAEGLALLNSSMERALKLAMRLHHVEFGAYQAFALHQAGEIEQAVSRLDGQFRLLDETDERYYEPELWRLRAALELSAQSTRSYAERSLLKAIAVAERHGSETFRLRAACDLARLYATLGEGKKGWEILHPAYTSFTEGFGQPDLISAKDLLNHLSRSSIEL